MAKKAKAAEADSAASAETGDAAPEKKSGLVGRVLGSVLGLLGFLRFLNPLALLKLPRKLQIIAAGAILLVAGGGTVAWMFLGGSSEEAHVAADEAHPAPVPVTRLASEHTTFFDMPDIIVNIQTPDGAPAYLKLAVSLEIEQPDAHALIEPVMPRVIDQFQTYLRELRVEDIRGSAGVMRLKEELLRRVNFALAPLPVRDVLLKEMIVQ